MMEQLLTIGAYGFDERRFLDALVGARVDLFVDVRARRGMRGIAYAFANAGRLQTSLADAGIRYAHARELAPPQSVRDAQAAADRSLGLAKRARTELSESFVAAYRRECLCTFNAAHFADGVCGGAARPVLFCVERDPAACHRSLLARAIGDQLSVPVLNLSP
jgi:uncharacterized protein (DUF488 family)